MPHSHIQALPLRTPRGLVARTLSAVSTALTRRRERQRLSLLDAHMLRDIGLAAQDARRECQKPFWQA